MRTWEIEIAVAKFFGYRTNIIVPNVWWGLGLNYECDLLIVSKAGYATEIEIKVSEGDIKKETLKHPLAHCSNKIRRFSYAVPEQLVNSEWLPKSAGLISVNERTRACKTIRPPRLNKNARPLTDAEIKHLLHMGCMRIWSLKERWK